MMVQGGKKPIFPRYRIFPRADSVRIPSPVNGQMNATREASMKITVFAALLLASTLAAGSAAAQPFPFNEVGVTMGHWHIASKDVEANKKIFVGMGGKWFKIGANEYVMFPGVFVHINLGTTPGNGGSQGSVVNHVGFIVNNVQEQVARWKAAGIAVLPGNNNRLDQAYVETPDGVRMEILEDKAQSMISMRTPSGESTCTCPCLKVRSPRPRPGMPRLLAARQAPATMPRSSTFRAPRSALPRPTSRRLERWGARSTTSAST